MIVVINGVPRSGKDEFVKQCQACWGDHIKNISTIDFVKEIAKECGWDGVKTPQSRKFLSNLKDLLIEFNDLPYKKVADACHCFGSEMASYGFKNNQWIVFVHCREPEEITKFEQRLGAISILIRRAAVENDGASNHADANVFAHDYTYTVRNDGTIADLAQKAIKFLKLVEDYDDNCDYTGL